MQTLKLFPSLPVSMLERRRGSMTPRILKTFALATFFFPLTGCSHYHLSKSICEYAINWYYATRPVCLRTTPDPAHPSWGNICIGIRTVTSIDSFSKPWNGMPRTASVKYHYAVINTPAWAHSSEVQSAYPEIIHALNGTHEAEEHLVAGRCESDHCAWSVIPPETVVE